MTITISIPSETETLLKAEADRIGVAVEQLIARVITERFESLPTSATESATEFFNRVARPGPVIDLTRDNIYADA